MLDIRECSLNIVQYVGLVCSFTRTILLENNFDMCAIEGILGMHTHISKNGIYTGLWKA